MPSLEQRLTALETQHQDSSASLLVLFAPLTDEQREQASRAEAQGRTVLVITFA